MSISTAQTSLVAAARVQAASIAAGYYSDNTIQLAEKYYTWLESKR